MVRIIEARGITHEYPDGSEALSTVDFTLREGERVLVTGPNGSGKSTLQLILGGLLEPTAGDVEYFEKNTDPDAVRDRIGVLLQNPDDYLFNPTVRADLKYGPAQFEMPHEKATVRIDQLASELNLTELLEKPPFRLSGGEKQRAALASTLSFDPEVLLLDEPLSAIDGRYRERVLDLITEYVETSIVFTPNLELAPLLADRIVLIGKGGAIVADDDIREILTDETLLQRHGLQPPAIVQLLDDFTEVGEETPLTLSDAKTYIRQRLER